MREHPTCHKGKPQVPGTIGSLREPLKEGSEKGDPGSQKKPQLLAAFFRDPFGARTQDPSIKSAVLYLLS